MCEVHSLIWDNLLPTYKTNFYTHVHTEQKATEAQGHYSHSGDVFSRKGICGVTDQQAGLPYSSAEGKRDKHEEGYGRKHGGSKTHPSPTQKRG